MVADEQHGALLGKVLGGYRLVELIGAGGMAEVYRGTAPPDLDVAVKILPPELASDPGYVGRFRAEAQRAAALRHPNVVPVHRFGEELGVLYIIMPVLPVSLRDRMDRDGVYEPTEAIRIALEMASALDAAHTYGIMHRDVKPENILLAPDGRALLTDFGIARDLDVLGGSAPPHTLSITGLPVGTPEYMAPEQLGKAPFDHRVDIYSLGVVLYEMLTGIVPHDASTPLAVAARVLHERVPPPSIRRPEIWPALDQVILTAMASNPYDRYPNMRSLAAGLQRAHTQRPITTPLLSVPQPAPPSRPLAALGGAHTASTLIAPRAARADIENRTTLPMPLTGGWSEARGWRAPLEWMRATPRSPLAWALIVLLALLALAVLVLVGSLLVQTLTTVRFSIG